MTLLEQFKGRIKLAEDVYAKEHKGENLSESKKLVIARVLRNTSDFLTESLGPTNGTQRSDIGEYKKFCLDLTNLSLPNLIAHDLVLVKAMASITGFIQYLKITAGSTKGGVENGTVFNDPFRLGAMNEARINYTAAPVTEVYGFADADASAHKIVGLLWTPVVRVAKVLKKANGADTWTELVVDTDYTVNLEAGTITLTVALVDGDEIKVAYVYDNTVFPADDIPRLKAHMEGISLAAKARRIAIEYSQLAAFQLKNETGADLGKILATQAVAELNYEIDSEIIDLLDKTSGVADAETTFNKVPNVGVSRSQHYEGFAETVEAASRKIYDRTKRFNANYMVIASDILQILSLTSGWKPVNTAKNGPFFAGTFNSLKVFVTPQLAPGRFFVGFNDNELSASPAVYAPYMSIVPTAALNFADGGVSQGFATMYDLKVLNPELVAAGQVTNIPLNSVNTSYTA